MGDIDIRFRTKSEYKVPTFSFYRALALALGCHSHVERN